ncbi:MAG: ectonucleotide pyrophosphatase/phosphodiesterase [Caldilineaceae bacterium]
MSQALSSPVILIMIDGLRPDALAATACPNLQGFRQRGASTLTASSVMPSVTLPCHTSIFHSVPPSRHGITTNQWQPMARPLPGLIEVAAEHKRRCAFICNWDYLRDVYRPGKMAYAYFDDSAYDPAGDETMVAEALRYFRQARPDFMFVYQSTVDVYGHNHGWMSDEYLRHVTFIDGVVGRLLDGLPEEVTILIQSDHGGHERTHGTDLPEDMTIPWLIAGPPIKQNYTITAPVSLLDTAPTLATLLGIPPHEEWEGRCVDEVFVSGTVGQ